MKPRSEQAFSLLEVMIAMGIFFVAIFGILGLMSDRPAAVAGHREDQLRGSALDEAGEQRVGSPLAAEQRGDARYELREQRGAGLPDDERREHRREATSRTSSPGGSTAGGRRRPRRCCSTPRTRPRTRRRSTQSARCRACAMPAPDRAMRGGAPGWAMVLIGLDVPPGTWTPCPGRK